MRKSDQNKLRIFAAQEWIQFLDENDRAGMIDYSTEAAIIQPLVQMAKNEKEVSQARAGRIGSDGDWTDITEALARAYQLLIERKEISEKTAVLLLTDGKISLGNKVKGRLADDQNLILESRNRLYREVLPKYKKLNLPIYTIGLSGGIDESLLEDIAKSTGADYHYSPTAEEIKTSFLAILQPITGWPYLIQEDVSLALGQTVERRFYIDEYTTVFSAVFHHSFGDRIQVDLFDPQGRKVDENYPGASISPDPRRKQIETDRIAFTFEKATKGWWRSQIVSRDPGNVKISIKVILHKAQFNLSFQDLIKEGLTNQPYKVSGYLNFKGDKSQIPRLLKDVKIDLVVTNGQGSQVLIPLHDDGITPDKTKNDQVFSGFFSETKKPGDYKLTLKASARLRTFGDPILREISEKITLKPNFIIKPDVINLGEVEAGSETACNLMVLSSFLEKRNLRIELGDVGHEVDSEGKLVRPKLSPGDIQVMPQKENPVELKVAFPATMDTGDYSVRVFFVPNQNELGIALNFHVLSRWDKYGKWFKIVFTLIFILIILKLAQAVREVNQPVFVRGFLKVINAPEGSYLRKGQVINFKRQKKSYSRKFKNKFVFSSKGKEIFDLKDPFLGKDRFLEFFQYFIKLDDGKIVNNGDEFIIGEITFSFLLEEIEDE
jgi:hypothetical protein